MHGVVFWRDLSADFPAIATALPSAAQACICEQFLSSPADHVAIRQGYSLLILQLNYRKACRHAREVLAELLRNCGHKTDFRKKKALVSSVLLCHQKQPTTTFCTLRSRWIA